MGGLVNVACAGRCINSGKSLEISFPEVRDYSIFSEFSESGLQAMH